MKHHQQFKTGSASFYTVIVTCMLLGVIVVSFTYLVIREQTKDIENNLSRSAYNSALAGIEDAKLALSAYYNCINTGESSKTSTLPCNEIKSLIESSPNNCDAVAKILGRNGTEGGEVLVQETNSGQDTTVQAYTCVKVSPYSPDYRGTIDNASPTRVIPLYQTESPDKIAYVKLHWYSSANAEMNSSQTSFLTTDQITKFPNNDDTPIPPVLAASLLQTDKQFTLADLDDATDAAGTDRGTVWLVPTSETGKNEIAKNDLINSNKHNDNRSNTPYPISCVEGADYSCSAKINLPSTFNGNTRNSETLFLILNLPYEHPDTDFRIEAYDDSNNLIKFKDAQVTIDSTGRANDIYSRLEARLEYRDIYYPFAEYAIDLSGDKDSASLSKSLWASHNCWTVKNGEIDNETCQEQESRAQTLKDSPSE